jgi:hypothetical protein
MVGGDSPTERQRKHRDRRSLLRRLVGSLLLFRASLSGKRRYRSSPIRIFRKPHRSNRPQIHMNIALPLKYSPLRQGLTQRRNRGAVPTRSIVPPKSLSLLLDCPPTTTTALTLFTDNSRFLLYRPTQLGTNDGSTSYCISEIANPCARNDAALCRLSSINCERQHVITSKVEVDYD